MKKKIIFYSGVLMAVLALTGCADKAQNNNDKADYTFAEKDSTAEESSEITSADTAGQESTKKLTTATETVTTTTI
ncbi:MAG: hypothetical protein K2N49_06095, partial [Ruminococcus sp.]|nr:hypothetical protein [Ruminococcus sp.]